MNKDNIDLLNEQTAGLTTEQSLAWFADEFKDKVVFGSSMGAEDQVITHMLYALGKPVRIFTLDTGRLFPETYNLIDETREKYGMEIEIFFPDSASVEKMVNDKGVNLFYRSVENRKQCCHIRKIEPSKRALSGMKVWITGIRKDQTISRFFNKMVEWDEQNSMIKFNPLLNWGEKQVWEYIRENEVPYNELHDKGFPSIGCQPCTRAVEKGEDLRAGRWWWEAPEHKECGLHNKGS